jgi:surface carbohydrate biosynthesis protein
MNIFIFFENKNIELNAKFLLALNLIKDKKVKNIYIGYTKYLLRDIFERFFFKKQNFSSDIILYKDLWENTEILIDFFKLLGFKYFSNHEEDTLTFSSKHFDSLKPNFLSKKYLKNIDSFFTISERTKEIYISKLGYNGSKILSSGSLRLDFLKKVKMLGHPENNEPSKKVLLCLGGAIFNRVILKKYVKIFDIKKYFKINSFEGNSLTDKKIFLEYHSLTLKKYIKIIKQNPNEKFILRIYPHDKEYIRYYFKLFKNTKNVEISYSEDIFYCFDRASKLICSPDNVAVEGILYGLPTRIFFDESNDMHNFIYKDHIALKLFPENIIKDIDYFNLNFKFDDNVINKNCEILKEYFGYNLDSVSVISKKILEEIYPNNLNIFQKIKNFFNIKVLKFIFKKIYFFYNTKKYENIYYDNFVKNLRFSFFRVFSILFFYKSKKKFDATNIIYKYLIGRSFNDHTTDEQFRTYDLIDLNKIELIKNKFQDNTFLNFKTELYHSHILLLRKDN